MSPITCTSTFNFISYTFIALNKANFFQKITNFSQIGICFNKFAMPFLTMQNYYDFYQCFVSVQMIIIMVLNCQGYRITVVYSTFE